MYKTRITYQKKVNNDLISIAPIFNTITSEYSPRIVEGFIKFIDVTLIENSNGEIIENYRDKKETLLVVNSDLIATMLTWSE